MSVHPITDKLWPCFPFGQLESVMLPTLRSMASGTHLPVIPRVSLKAGLVEPSLKGGWGGALATMLVFKVAKPAYTPTGMDGNLPTSWSCRHFSFLLAIPVKRCSQDKRASHFREGNSDSASQSYRPEVSTRQV